MQLEKISLPDTHSFSPFFLDYINGVDALRAFYNYAPTIENFAQQIEAKAEFPESSRKILSDTLQQQYGSLKTTELVKENIISLQSSKTFTITTGHQQNIFTGPLYFIYKIVTVINICKALKQRYPEYNFVPVYWMASEDHDFEEISYFRLYGKKYTWQTKQTGAVGRFNPGSLGEILKELPGDTTFFKEAYLKNSSLSNAVRSYVNALFGNEGLIVIDADDHNLKNQLRPVMTADLTDHITRTLVDDDTSKLKSLGYHTQVNARDVNFFFLDNGIRDRIENDKNGFNVVNQEIRLSNDEMKKLIDLEPEKLSPNVILRPLYQEIILPNLAYIGGPSEVVYWLQLKSVFTYFKIPFPILMPRNFSMVVENSIVRKFEKTKLEIKDLFEDKNFLFNHWTLQNTQHNLSLSSFIDEGRLLFENIKKQASVIDPTLTAHVEAKGKQTIQQLEIIEKKMLRAEKRKQQEKLKQIEIIKDALFPGGNLQERTDNFLNFYQSNTNFINDLLNSLDPFDYRMHVLMYHE